MYIPKYFTDRNGFGIIDTVICWVASFPILPVIPCKWANSDILISTGGFKFS